MIHPSLSTLWKEKDLHIKVMGLLIGRGGGHALLENFNKTEVVKMCFPYSGSVQREHGENYFQNVAEKPLKKMQMSQLILLFSLSLFQSRVARRNLPLKGPLLS